VDAGRRAPDVPNARFEQFLPDLELRVARGIALIDPRLGSQFGVPTLGHPTGGPAEHDQRQPGDGYQNKEHRAVICDGACLSFSVLSARTLSLRGCRADVRQNGQASVARHIPHKVSQKYQLYTTIPPRGSCARALPVAGTSRRRAAFGHAKSECRYSPHKVPRGSARCGQLTLF